MSTVEQLGGTGLYEEATVIDRDALRDKFAAWSAGHAVASVVETIGRIPLPDECRDLLEDSPLHDREYGPVGEFDDLYVLTGPLRRALLQLAREDVVRAGLHARIRVQTVAGRYDRRMHAEPFHADYWPRQQVRWTVAHGMAGTVGALGEVSVDDLIGVEGDGTLRSGLVADRFQLVGTPEAEVARFSVSDVHVGPEEDGLRILTIATWKLPAR